MNPSCRLRSSWFACVLSTLLVLIAPAVLCAQTATTKTTKKLIEFGWDAPTTAFIRKHRTEMEKAPFDGTVIYVVLTNADGKPGNYFFWEVWGERTITDAEVGPAIEDLKATSFQRFTHNFIRFDTAPGKLDWFDDHSKVVSNARLAARIAREGKCAGILFDVEQYEGAILFNYPKQRDIATKSWDEYAAKARQRGREVMEAFQEGFPDLVVLLTFAHSLPWKQAEQNRERMPEAQYGLLAPFVDGLIDGVKGKTKLVDGHELSYSFRDPAKYPAAYQTMSEGVMPIVGDPEKYRRTMSFGFGIWLDYNSDNIGWHPNDLSKNHFTPETLEVAARAALETSDEYAWIYTERLRWWAEESGGKPVNLPPAYAEALRRARAGLARE